MPNLSVGGAQLSVTLVDIIKNQRGDDAAYRAKKEGGMVCGRALSFKASLILVITAVTRLAWADNCPTENEKIITTPYLKSYVCPSVKVIASGSLNPEKYQSCLGDVPSSSERVKLVYKDGRVKDIPKINYLFKNVIWLREKTWIVSAVKCNGNDSLSIRYWGGGNCDLCSKWLTYK